MRSFYPPRKKGHSHRHFVKPSAARHSVTRSGRPATMGLNSIRHGRICSHLRDCLGLPSIDFVFPKPCLVSNLPPPCSGLVNGKLCEKSAWTRPL